MAQSGGGGFGWFVIGVAVGAAAVYFGPNAYRQYVQQNRVPVGGVRVEVAPEYTPGEWRRTARLEIEFSRYKANGQNWDWPMVDPELQVCIREGTEFRKCYGPLDGELAACKGKFRCTTAPIRVPSVAFSIELNEWDDYNQPDPIGAVTCDIGQVCKFGLGQVTVRDAGTVSSAAP
jgi:hypothetical protein